jgi:SPP1 gp7 family putative phage head morphogenesis protein
MKAVIKEQLKQTLFRDMKTKKAKELQEAANPPMKIMTNEEKLKMWTDKNELFRKYLPIVRAAMTDVFREQRKETLPKFEVLKNLFKASSGDIYNKVKLNIKKETARTLKITLPSLITLFKESGDLTFEELGLDMTMDVNVEEIDKIMGEVGRKFAKEATKKTNIDIRKAIINGLANGESIADIQKRVKEVFVGAEDFRSERIARTEALRYNTAATEQAFVDSGIVEGKEWFANPTACEACLPMNGKIISLGENFFTKGENANGIEVEYSDIGAPPLHPNCECDLVPVFKPKE